MRIRVGDRVFCRRGRKVYRVVSVRKQYDEQRVMLRNVVSNRLLTKWVYRFPDQGYRVQLIARPLLLPVGA